MVSLWTIALGSLAALITLVAIYQFNRMVTLRNRCEEAWSNVDTELKRRYDLVPNLVKTVKGYAQHERDLIAEVTEARARALTAHDGVDAQAREEHRLARGLERLLAVAEDYPELQASDQFLALQEELAITEDRIQAARRFYNGNVRDYRNHVRGFPGLVFARAFGFGEQPFFEVEPLGRELPRVREVSGS